MRVAHMPYKRLVKGIYGVRVVVPDEPGLRLKVAEIRAARDPRFRGKIAPVESLVESTGTRDEAAHNRLATPIIQKFQGWIDAARADLAGDVGPRYWHPGTPWSIGGHLSESPLSPEWAERHRRANEAWTAPITVAKQELSFDDLVENWKTRKNVTDDKAIAAKKRAMHRLGLFLGHQDAARVIAADLHGFPGWLLTDHPEHKLKAVGTKTVGDDYVPSIKTLFGEAKKVNKLTVNPADELSFVGFTAPEDERRDFTDTEQANIIRLALASDNPVIKWGNLFAAYHGARLAEIVEAHTRDIQEMDGVWIMHIRLQDRLKATPGARLKNKPSHRPVPIHSAVIAAGFLDYLNSLPEGPLFPLVPLDRQGRRNHRANLIIMPWLRKQAGIIDPNADFHSWRHGFKTFCRRYQIEEQYADAIAGHSNGSIGRTYGYYPPSVLAREIEKLPRMG